MDDAKINKALALMKSDIVNSCTIFSNDPPANADNYNYYISVYAKNEDSLFNASRLFYQIGAKSSQLSIMPPTYKSCKFDCFTVSRIFDWMRYVYGYNILNTCFIECDDIEDGDFYISVTRENKKTKMVDIVSFRTLSYYTK